MKFRSTLFAAAFAVCAAPTVRAADAPAEFPKEVRDAIRALASADVKDSLAAASGAFGAGRAIVIAPIAGDRDNETRNQLKNAVTAAGLVCVEASDDMWEAIMKELGFNEGFKDMLDQRSMTRLGELLPSEVMLYGRVRASRPAAGKRAAAAPEVELSLHAADLRTRRHVWGSDFVSPKPGAGGAPAAPAAPQPALLPTVGDATAADLAVFVTARPADNDSSDLAAELLSAAREAIGAQGFQIAFDSDDADIAVQLTVRKSVFDRTGGYAVMEGSVNAIAVVPARKGFYLGETRIDRERGERRLGDRDAMLAVSDLVSPKLVSWLGQTVTVEKTGLAAVRIPCDISMLEDENAVAKFVSDFCRETARIDGIARCVLDGQTPETATFYVSYIRDRVPEGPLNAIRARHPELFPKAEEEVL